MPLIANITLNVPALPENDIWFANAQAWNNYWNNVGGPVTINPADTVPYVAVSYDTTLQPCYITIDGVPYALVTVDMFNSLKAQVNALDASYQQLRTALLDAGIIDEF